MVKIALGTILLLYVVCVIVMYSSPAARELVIYLHPCKCIKDCLKSIKSIIKIHYDDLTVWNSVLITALLLLISYQVKNPFEDLSNPVSFGLPENTVNFYISGQAGKLGAW